MIHCVEYRVWFMDYTSGQEPAEDKISGLSNDSLEFKKIVCPELFSEETIIQVSYTNNIINEFQKVLDKKFNGITIQYIQIRIRPSGYATILVGYEFEEKNHFPLLERKVNSFICALLNKNIDLLEKSVDMLADQGLLKKIKNQHFGCSPSFKKPRITI